MKKLFLLIFSITILTSCVTKHISKSTASLIDYYNQKPDLTNVKYEGGDGKTSESAIIIKNAHTERNGNAAAYAYIEKIYGMRNIGWKLLNESSITINKRYIDTYKIQLMDNNEIIILNFDITEFFGVLQ